MESQETTPQAKYHSFDYRGSGGELFGLFLVNILLTVLTFGIYYFWAKVKLTRYFYENTEFMGHNFSYHGTGSERFVGFIKGILLIGLGAGVFTAVGFFLTMVLSEEIATSIAGFLFYLTLLAIGPLLLIGKERYRLSRSSYRNIRFRFTGKFEDLTKIFLTHGLLSFLSFGIYTPWFICKLNEFFAQNSYYGNQNFHFEADPMDLFFIYLKAFFLVPLTFGIYYSWFNAELYRFYWGHVSFQNKRFNARGFTGSELLITMFIYFMIISLSFGIAAPWALTILMKLKIGSLNLYGTIDFAAIEGSMDKEASALSDGISDAADVIGDMLGG